MIKQVYSFDFKKEIGNGTTVVNFYSNLGSPS
ncbi:thiol reductase thioredoxin, partial [Clostridium botulinum]|nr:thiol reductase thioredoxin [Clostridium botulinum]